MLIGDYILRIKTASQTNIVLFIIRSLVGELNIIHMFIGVRELWHFFVWDFFMSLVGCSLLYIILMCSLFLISQPDELSTY